MEDQNLSTKLETSDKDPIHENQKPETQDLKTENEVILDSSVTELSDLPTELASELASEPAVDSSSSSSSSPSLNKKVPLSEKFKAEMDAQKNNEEKLQKAVEIMETSLSQSGTPDFKSFWESRTFCLELFKEDIPAVLKSNLWKKYHELTKEARRLKDFFEEKTAFAVEQIEIAIKALETDVENLPQLLAAYSVSKLPKRCDSLSHHYDQYNNLQNELDILNTFAARINSLRKELIKTDMRIRHKNKFFERLSKIGNQIFPRRKELIKEVSDLFISDIERFMNNYFENPSVDRVFSLRQEIKSLQSVAKVLTINTHSFNQTRTKLADCWEKLKVLDKEKKKMESERQQLLSENADIIAKKIEEFDAQVKEGNLSVTEGQKQIDEISKSMREIELGRDEVRALRQKMSEAQRPLREKQEEEAKKRKQLEQAKEVERRDRIQKLEEKIGELSASDNSEHLVASLRGIREEMDTLSLTETEEKSLKQKLIPVEDTVIDLEEESMIANKQFALVLKKRQERRDRIKEKIANYRKLSGGSGLDFEQSLHYNECLNIEKKRLDHINKEIEEVEIQMKKR